MKRTVIFLIALTAALCSNAQIRDTFFGFKLGVATKAQVISGLKSQGKACNYDKANNLYYIENITFAGTEWQSCILEFYKDSLYLVGFGQLYEDKKDAFELFERNLRNIQIKYDSIKEDTITNNPNDKHYKYDDGKIVMSVSYNQDDNLLYHTNIIYQSRNLIIQKKNDYMDDL